MNIDLVINATGAIIDAHLVTGADIRAYNVCRSNGIPRDHTMVPALNNESLSYNFLLVK